MIEVAEPDNVKLGGAEIRTVVSNNVIKNYDIEIININKSDATKNILFKITDEELLDKTGGVVAGMSGSPIVQDDKIIGAVTHVVVNDPQKGYGIFITTMLEEGEKKEWFNHSFYILIYLCYTINNKDIRRIKIWQVLLYICV